MVQTIRRLNAWSKIPLVGAHWQRVILLLSVGALIALGQQFAQRHAIAMHMARMNAIEVEASK